MYLCVWEGVGVCVCVWEGVRGVCLCVCVYVCGRGWGVGDCLGYPIAFITISIFIHSDANTKPVMFYQ